MAGGSLTATESSYLRAMGPISGFSKFSVKIWASCFSPQDAFILPAKSCSIEVMGDGLFYTRICK